MSCNICWLYSKSATFYIYPVFLFLSFSETRLSAKEIENVRDEWSKWDVRNILKTSKAVCWMRGSNVKNYLKIVKRIQSNEIDCFFFGWYATGKCWRYYSNAEWCDHHWSVKAFWGFQKCTSQFSVLMEYSYQPPIQWHGVVILI